MLELNNQHLVLPSPTAVTIVVDSKSLDELEQEMREAERKAEEARQLALQLKQRINYARSQNSTSPTH